MRTIVHTALNQQSGTQYGQTLTVPTGLLVRLTSKGEVISICHDREQSNCSGQPEFVRLRTFRRGVWLCAKHREQRK